MLARKHKISLPRVLSKLLQSLHTVHHDVLCGDLAMRTMTFSQNRDKVLRAQVSLLRLRLSSNIRRFESAMSAAGSRASLLSLLQELLHIPHSDQ